jgi:hypothetical protein
VKAAKQKPARGPGRPARLSRESILEAGLALLRRAPDEPLTVARIAAEVDAVYGAGTAAANNFDPSADYNLERQLAGRKDLSFETSASLSGGTDDTKYFASASVKNDEGIIQNTGFQRQSLRLNLDQRFSPRISATINTNLLHTRAGRGLTNNDNTGTSYYVVFSATPSFADLTQGEDGLFRENPFTPSNPLQTAALSKNDEDVWRLLGGSTVTLSVLQSAQQSLQLISTGGVDFFSQKNDLFFPPELQFEPNDGEAGTALLSNSDNLNVTGTVSLGNANLDLTAGITVIPGDEIVIVRNDGVDAIVGKFAQGDLIQVGSQKFAIDYTYAADPDGVHNDVALIRYGAALGPDPCEPGKQALFVP